MRLISGRSHLNEEDAASEANDRDACRDDAKKSACHCDAAFLKLFNSSSDLITISSMKRGTLLDVNDSFLRVTGYHRDSVVGHTELELGLWPPARDWAKMAEALQRGPVLNVEVTFLTRAGERRTGLMSAQPIHLRDEQCLLTVVKDTTEGRQTEAELGRLSAVVERSKEAVLITGVDGTIVYANPAFAEITGYTREQTLGKNPRFLKSGKQEHELYKDLWDTILAGKIWHGEMTNRRQDGSLYVQGTTIIPVQDNHGVTNHFIAIGLDVTEQRRTEAQLQQAQKMEFVGRLAGGVAHDFNNLLTVISGYGQLLKERLETDSPLQACCEEVLQAGERAAGLTRQLLAFSRRQIVVPQVLDLNSVVADLEKMLTRLIREDIELVTVPQQDLWTVKADRGQMEQVLVNLAVNARDAMPQGGKLAIQTANRTLDESFARTHMGAAAGPHVMLAVSDTGMGMDVETLAHIFEPFFTTKEEGKGTGLGLSTVYGIVKQSAGSIWAYSEPGRGSTFKIYLPRSDEPVSQVGQAMQRPKSTAGSETVLVVEDEQGVLSLVCNTLAAQGYKVLEAHSPLKAASILGSYAEPIHMLLTDVVMPQMSGKVLANHVAALHPGTRVLYMSGYTDDAIVRHGILEPNTFLLQKPFTPSALLQKVREVLDADRPSGPQESCRS
jgi:two-component system cell cycle sensor histidine kinase/response regulator CckA